MAASTNVSWNTTMPRTTMPNLIWPKLAQAPLRWTKEICPTIWDFKIWNSVWKLLTLQNTLQKQNKREDWFRDLSVKRHRFGEMWLRCVATVTNYDHVLFIIVRYVYMKLGQKQPVDMRNYLMWYYGEELPRRQWRRHWTREAWHVGKPFSIMADQLAANING